MLTGIVLCGGQSSRMNQPNDQNLSTGQTRSEKMNSKPRRCKSLVPFVGRPMLWHVASHVNAVCDSLLIAAGRFQREAQQALADFSPDYSLVEDQIADEGPLVGLASALTHVTDGKSAVVVSVDLPLLTGEILQDLAQHVQSIKRAATKAAAVEAVLLSADGRINPLAGIYHSSCGPKLISVIRQGQRRSMTVLDILKCEIVNVADLPSATTQALINVNTESQRLAAQAAANNMTERQSLNERKFENS